MGSGHFQLRPGNSLLVDHGGGSPDPGPVMPVMIPRDGFQAKMVRMAAQHAEASGVE